MNRRAAVVGLGKQALEDHLPARLACDHAELVAVCDNDPDVLREQQRKLAVPGYRDYDELFHLGAVPVLVRANAIPPEAHGPGYRPRPAGGGR